MWSFRSSRHLKSFPITADTSLLFIHITSLGKVVTYTKTHLQSSEHNHGQAVLSRLTSCCQDSDRKKLFSRRTTCYSPGSVTMMSLDPGTQCVAEANRVAHWDRSNKANANRYALIFIYVHTVIYVCVNCGGYQLFSSATWCGLYNWIEYSLANCH